MAYSKQTWDTTSYVNPTRMNHIEDGIAGVDTKTASDIPYSSGVSVAEMIRVIPLTENISFTANTWTQGYFQVSANTCPTGYKVIGVYASDNYPWADLIFANYKEEMEYVGYMTYGTRTGTFSTDFRVVCVPTSMA